eukprot:428232-Rhodomonas_salina.5
MDISHTQVENPTGHHCLDLSKKEEREVTTCPRTLLTGCGAISMSTSFDRQSPALVVVLVGARHNAPAVHLTIAIVAHSPCIPPCPFSHKIVPAPAGRLETSPVEVCRAGDRRAAPAHVCRAQRRAQVAAVERVRGAAAHSNIVCGGARDSIERTWRNCTLSKEKVTSMPSCSAHAMCDVQC